MNIFHWVIETSISASIIVLIVMCIRAVIKKRVNPCILYYMWFVVIIKLIMPNGPESQISIYNVFSKSEVSVVENINKVESRNIISDINLETILNETENELQQTTINEKIDYLTVKEMLCIIWVIGIGFLLIKSIYSYFALRKYIKYNKYYNYVNEVILLECLNILSLKSKVKIVISDKFQSPALFGIMKPKIIIPKTIMEKSTSEELKYILLHELTHLKRKDNIVIWILFALKIIYWFNPIIIMAIKLMQRDCEISCDANVLDKVDDKESINYGMAILKVLSSINSNKTYIGTTTMIRKKKDVKERINMISRNKKYGFKTLIAGIVLIGILSGVALTSKNAKKVNADDNISSTEENINKLVDKENNTEEAVNNIKENTNPKVIIYNAHYDEDYAQDLKVTDASELLESNLKANGVEAEFLRNTKTVSYPESYEAARALIIENVENYEEKILIDIHRTTGNDKDEQERRQISIMLNESNLKYEENVEFASKIINELVLQGVVPGSIKIISGIEEVDYLNQDLSTQAIMLEIGSGASDKLDLEFCTEKIAKSIKNLE